MQKMKFLIWRGVLRLKRAKVAVGGIAHAGIALAMLTALPAIGQPIGNCDSPVADAYIDIANVRARIPANGNLVWAGEPGVYEVPKGGGADPIFAASLWMGAMIDGEVRVAAARFGNYQFWTGPLDENATPPVDCSSYDRIWKVNRADVTALETTGTVTSDLVEWPTGLGAPTLSSRNPDGTETATDGI